MSQIPTCLRWKFPCAVLFFWGLATVAPAQSTEFPAKPAVPIPVEVVVPSAPMVFLGDGSRHLVYEIYVTNMSDQAWVLRRIGAIGDGGQALLNLDGKDLQDTLRHPGRPDLEGDALYEVAPGERVIAFLWINFSGSAPKQLRHDLIFRKSGEDKLLVIDAAATKVSDARTTVTSPLRGKNWVAGNGPSNASKHRRTIIVTDGTPHIAQRYAIDWVQIDPTGATYKGEAKDNRSYYCYGAEAFAVADATVVEVKDGIPQNTPGGPLAVEITAETVAGNHVNLDLGGGVFAMYAHFQPGSIRVRVGDKVSRGLVLGLVGNSGNSSEPHLHFQLMDRNSPLGSEGLPYKMDFQLTGQISGSEPPKIDHLPFPQPRQGEIPMENEIVDF